MIPKLKMTPVPSLSYKGYAEHISLPGVIKTEPVWNSYMEDVVEMITGSCEYAGFLNASNARVYSTNWL